MGTGWLRKAGGWADPAAAPSCAPAGTWVGVTGTGTGGEAGAGGVGGAGELPPPPPRVRDWSSDASRYLREPPPCPYGPGHMSQPAFVETTISSRYGRKSSRIRRPKFTSAAPYGGP